MNRCCKEGAQGIVNMEFIKGGMLKHLPPRKCLIACLLGWPQASDNV